MARAKKTTASVNTTLVANPSDFRNKKSLAQLKMDEAGGINIHPSKNGFYWSINGVEGWFSKSIKDAANGDIKKLLALVPNMCYIERRDTKNPQAWVRMIIMATEREVLATI